MSPVIFSREPLGADRARLESSQREDLYAEVVSRCRDSLTRADRVLLLIQEGKSFQVKASFGSKAVYINTNETVSRSILRRVRRTQRAISIADALTDRELAAQKSVNTIGQRSVLCAPITLNGKCEGVLYIDSISLVGAFTDEEFRWTIRLANSLARKLPKAVDQVEAKNAPSAVHPPALGSKRQSESSPNHQAASRAPLGHAQKSRPAGLAPIAISGPTPALSDLAVFFRSLSCLLGAGVSLSQSVAILSEAKSPLSGIATHIADDLRKGFSFSAALTRFPTVFALDSRSLVNVGENSGTLDTVMESLALNVEKNWRIWEKLKSALTYPSPEFDSRRHRKRARERMGTSLVGRGTRIAL